ncbi:interleukin-23 receptor-like [Mobula hypostoma]|uniref:interleukin-23 receptor-like n=1 Tax=Mobula hypostoma TaxID=723540 RepID=UPI002FC32211
MFNDFTMGLASIIKTLMAIIFYIKSFVAAISLVEFPGRVVVKPAPVFLVGSNISITCVTGNQQCNINEFKLDINRKTVQMKRFNNTAAHHWITNVTTHNSVITCYVQCIDGTDMLVCRADLQSGYPPGQPRDLKCVWRKNYMQCMWKAGKKTFLATRYTLHVQSVKTGKEQRFPAESRTSNVTVPRHHLKDALVYKVWVQAVNALGNATSKRLTFELNDIVVPDTPEIIKAEFINNSSCKAIIHWKKSTPSAKCDVEVKYKVTSEPEISWTRIAKSNITGNSSYLSHCEPFREYEFQIRCIRVQGYKYSSEWSRSFITKTPEAEPVGVLDAWSLHEPAYLNKHRKIIICWKPLRHPQETRGIILGYHLYYLQNGQRKFIQQNVTETQYSWRTPWESDTVFITAFNSKGNTTPSVLHIGEAKLKAPRNLKVERAKDFGVLVKWEPPDETSEPVLGYVVDWIEATNRDKELLSWKRLPRANLSLFIAQTSSSQDFLTEERGVMPRKRYNISVTAVYQNGRGRSSLVQGYSVEGKPTMGPNVSLMKLDGPQVQIKWEEIPLEQRQGFIIGYTIYVKRGSDGSSLVPYNITNIATRSYWLTLEFDMVYTIHMTATTSAGEGEKGTEIPIKLEYYGIALPLQLSLGISIPTAFLLALTLAKSVRKRIKTTLKVFLPGWVHEEFPDVENSKVAKGLEKKDEYPFPRSPMHRMYNDPPITEVQEALLPKSNRNSIQNFNENLNHEIDQGDFKIHILDTPEVQNSDECQIIEEVEIGYKPQSSVCQVPTLSHNEDQSIRKDEIAQDEEYKGFNIPVFHGVADISTIVDTSIDLSSGHRGAPEPLKYLLRREETHFPLIEHHGMYATESLPQEQTLLPDELVDCLLHLEENSTGFKSYFPQIVAIQ